MEVNPTERQPEPVELTLTPDGMVMVGAIKYIASRRQTELIRALGTAPGQFLSTTDVNETLESLHLRATSAEHMQRWMDGMLRFSKGMFEVQKDEKTSKIYYRMLGHVSVKDATIPPEQDPSIS